jgi:alpha-galactosidase
MSKWFLLFAWFIPIIVSGQDISINQGWKFKTGDDGAWSKPDFNDSGWSPISIGKSWEAQGYDNYDGFAWYRLHIVIPSAIKEKAFIKERLRFDLGMIDDGDEVYLNGSLIGKNAGRPGDIKQGIYDVQRSYNLLLTDPRIHWDRENLIAVRVWDGGGDGGMYDGKYGISIMDLTDFIVINTNDNPFRYSPGRKISKKIILQSTNEKYDFTGKLKISIIDPVSGVEVFKQNLGIDFAKDRQFAYSYSAVLPEIKSYQAVYTFQEGRSGKELTLTESIPYILTPASSPSPKIHGPKVFGVRPGTPFEYKIPATGEKPFHYEATGLPSGLILDKETGIISGELKSPGSFRIKFVVRNKLGTSSKDFDIQCGDLIGLTPAMGWNSWNCWGLSVSAEKVKSSAKVMLEKLADHGWAYINIDDGWQDKRDAQGEILPNNKFPDMKALCDYVHGLGLKIGIYSSPGTLTCGGYVASYQHEQQDAETYSRWGIDYLKYDWCSYGKIAPASPSLEDYKKPYQVMRKALDQVKRSIIFSFCQYGMGDVWKWGAEVGGNSWRTTGDITDNWSSMSSIGFSQDKSSPYTQPGHFNDPDMLVVGKVGWGPGLRLTHLSPDEQYTHISLWALLSAPLLIGCDLSQADDFTMNLLTNDEVLAIDQDVLAKKVLKKVQNPGFQVWVKELEDGSKALGLFNLSDKSEKETLSFSSLELAPRLKLRDLWRQQDLGLFTSSFNVVIPAHGVVLLKAKSSP